MADNNARSATKPTPGIERKQLIERYLRRKRFPFDSITVHDATDWMVALNYEGKAYLLCVDENVNANDLLERFHLRDPLSDDPEAEVTPAQLFERFAGSVPD